MLLMPALQVKRITDIQVKILKENNIKGIILDVDNTIIDLDKNPLEGIEEWIKLIKDNDIKICIASNSLKKEKIENIAKKIDVPYVYFSTKPFKRGLKRAKKILDIENSHNIAEVGDQIFTDVLGSNRMKMFSILTDPIQEEKVKLNNLKRKIEKKILERGRRKQNVHK